VNRRYFLLDAARSCHLHEIDTLPNNIEVAERGYIQSKVFINDLTLESDTDNFRPLNVFRHVFTLFQQYESTIISNLEF
jgi:hypothetical protein